MEKIVLIGYGGHAKSVADSIKAVGDCIIVGYTDTEDKYIEDLPYLGTDDVLQQLFDSGIHYAAFGLGYIGQEYTRDKIYTLVKEIGYQLPIIIDPTAIIAQNVRIGEGTFIGKRAVVNVGTSVGKMCLINTGAIVEHDNTIDNYSHIAVGATLCGNVKVGNHCFIGANSTVIQGLTIENNVIVGAGSVVIKNIRSDETVVGIPARSIEK